MTPAVRLMCGAGTATEIASVGKMKTSRTTTTASRIALGNSRGVAELVDVNRVDLDPGVDEESVDDQHDAREPVPRRQYVVGSQRCRGIFALHQVDRGHHDEKQAGISVPMKIPHDASRSAAMTPRAETSTAAQNRTMITTAV